MATCLRGSCVVSSPSLESVVQTTASLLMCLTNTKKTKTFREMTLRRGANFRDSFMAVTVEAALNRYLDSGSALIASTINVFASERMRHSAKTVVVLQIVPLLTCCLNTLGSPRSWNIVNVPVISIVVAAAPTLFVAEFGELLTNTSRTARLCLSSDSDAQLVAPNFVAWGAMDRNSESSSCLCNALFPNLK